MNNQLIQPEDKRFFVEKPNSSFSPERNRHVIQETIRETTAYFQKLKNELDRDMENRIDMFSSYATYRLGGSGTKGVRDYLGRDIARQLTGEKILSKVRALDTADKLGKTGRFIQV
jgi:hypothetical protein